MSPRRRWSPANGSARATSSSSSSPPTSRRRRSRWVGSCSCCRKRGQERGGGVAATPMTTILALEKISKRFGAIVVASAVDLALDEGEALGIIGPNGAGKTTLFGIATGTVAPDGGRVLLAGTDITRLSPDRRCRLGLARSFQIPQPFDGMTVVENAVVAAAFGQGTRERDVYE